MGPYQYAVHLISGPRLPFTAAYFGSIFMTIYFAVGVSGFLLSLAIPVFELRCMQGMFDLSAQVHLQVISRRAGPASLFPTYANYFFTAPQYYPHSVLGDHTNPRSGLVPRQLFPYGNYWSAFCSKSWRWKSRSLDERLIASSRSTKSRPVAHGPSSVSMAPAQPLLLLDGASPSPAELDCTPMTASVIRSLSFLCPSSL